MFHICLQAEYFLRKIKSVQICLIPQDNSDEAAVEFVVLPVPHETQGSSPLVDLYFPLSQGVQNDPV